MSRSRKRPIIKNSEHHGNTWGKRKASKAVRRHDNPLSNGKMYRKVFDSYDICEDRYNLFTCKYDPDYRKYYDKAVRK